MFSFTCGKKKNKQNKNKLIETENRAVVIRAEGGWRVGEMDEGGQLYGDGWYLIYSSDHFTVYTDIEL